MAATNDPAQQPGEKIITIDSIPYYTILEGQPDNPIVILIHALMSNHHIYDSTVLALHKAGYRTLRFDLVGHNKTPPPTDPGLNKQGAFTFDDFTHHIRTIFTTVTGNDSSIPAAVIGLLDWCSPDTKIISMAAPGLSTLPNSPPKWQARIAQWREEGSVTNVASQTVERWFPPSANAGIDVDQARRITESCTLDGYEICAWATMKFDYTNDLDKIEDGKNVMVLAGAEDGNIGPRSVLEDVSRRLRGSRYVLLEGVGHVPPMHGEVFESVLMEFLGR